MGKMDYLEDGKTLVILKDDREIFSSKKRGLRPLVEAIEFLSSQMKDSTIIDKVIGRAAAMLMVYAKVKEVYTVTISNPAKEVLSDAKIPFHFKNDTKTIMNNSGTGQCPMEKLSLEFEDNKEFLLRVKKILSNN